MPKTVGMEAIVRSHFISQPVEIQTPGGSMQPDHSLWVINPNPSIIWSSDDNIRAEAYGSLKPGETFAYDILEYADWCQAHLINWSIWLPKNAVVSVRFEVPEVGFYLEKTGKILGPVYSRESPELIQIAGSNGGIAKLVTLRFSIRNNGSRTAKSIAMSMNVALNLEPFQPNTNSEDPRFWWN